TVAVVAVAVSPPPSANAAPAGAPTRASVETTTAAPKNLLHLITPLLLRPYRRALPLDVVLLSGLEQPEACCLHGCLDPCAGAELPVQLCDVRFHRSFRQAEAGRRLPRGEAVGDAPQHLQLPWRDAGRHLV